MSYATSRLQDCAQERGEWKERAMYWARIALEDGATKARVAEILEVSRPTLDKWLGETGERTHTIPLELTEEQFRRMEVAVAYSGVTVEEFVLSAVLRRTRNVFRMTEKDREVVSA
jgi:transposase-like protein